MIKRVYKDDEALQKCAETLKVESPNFPKYPTNIQTVGYWENEDGTWTAYDNEYGDCWVEDFRSKKAAKAWAIGRDEKFWYKDKIS